MPQILHLKNFWIQCLACLSRVIFFCWMLLCLWEFSSWCTLYNNHLWLKHFQGIWNNQLIWCSFIYFNSEWLEQFTQEELLSKSFWWGDNNLIIFQFPFNIFMSFANLLSPRLQGQFSILRTISWADLYPPTRRPRRLLSSGRGRILIPGFIRSPPMLAVYLVDH